MILSSANGKKASLDGPKKSTSGSTAREYFVNHGGGDAGRGNSTTRAKVQVIKMLAVSYFRMWMLCYHVNTC